MQTPESLLKLNPVSALQPQAQAEYGPKKLIVLEADEVSLAGATLAQNYILGGHIDRDPLYTSLAPNSEHPGLLVAGGQITEATFIGH
ncbi:MAG: hypothetical protein AAFY17_06765 [Cyanobacteria bacterium J06642_11]